MGIAGVQSDAQGVVGIGAFTLLATAHRLASAIEIGFGCDLRVADRGHRGQQQRSPRPATA